MKRWAALLLVLLTGCRSSVAELSVGRAAVAPGAAAEIPVELKGKSITGLQFDLEYPPEVLKIEATLGPAAARAGKNLTVAEAARNKKRLLVVGMNNNAIPDGPVVVLTVAVEAGAAPGEYPLRLSAAAATNREAKQAPMVSSDGAVTVTSGR